MKRTFIGLLALFLCVFVLVGVMPAEAVAAEVLLQGDISQRISAGDDVSYVLYSDGKLVISGTGEWSGEYSSSGEWPVLPWEDYKDSIKTVVIESGVTNITHKAFSGCDNLSGITIPDTVNHIGVYAFSGCESLTDISIPESVKYIDGYAFSGSGVTEVIVPSGVTKIFLGTFSNCANLQSVTFPDGITSIGEYAFLNCSSLSDVNLPDGIVEIGKRAFYNCDALTNITVPGSVETWDIEVFLACDALTSVTFEEGCVEIPEAAFKDCGALTSVTIPDTVLSIGVAAFQSCSKLESISIPAGVSAIGDNTFLNCTSLTSVTIPDSVLSIGMSAFQNCSKLEEISIPVGVSYIGGSAFYRCSSLKSVELPEISAVYNNTFSYCEALSSVTIPSSVTYIDSYVFLGCDELKNVTFRGNAPTFHSNALTYITVRCNYPAGNSTWTSDVMQDYAGTVIWVEEGTDPGGKIGSDLSWVLTKDNVLTISGKGEMPEYDSDPYGVGLPPWYKARNLVDAIVIKKGIKNIGAYAFYGCGDLESVTIANTVENIGDYAFRGCGSLTAIVLPNGVKEIGSYAFYECGLLEKITLSDSLTQIGDLAFAFCDSLTSIKIPDSVTSLGNQVFEKCRNLKRVDIPGSVKHLYGVIFNDCVSLEEVTLGEGMEAVGGFKGCTNLKSISIPKTVKEIGSFAFYDCKSLESITFHSAIQFVCESAFFGCTNLSEVYFNGCNDVSFRYWYIESNAFSECSNLKKIYFTSNAPCIDEDAFTDVVAEVYFPKGNDTWTSDIQKDYGGSLTWKEKAYKPSASTVKAVNVTSSGKIKLTWEEISGAEKYQVYRADSKNGEYKKIKTTTSTSFTDKSAVAGKKYFYKVRAVSASGTKSSYSNIVSRTCRLARPSVTVKNTASTGKVKLSWKEIEGAEKYVVYRATSKNGEFKKLKTTSKLAYTDGSAKVGKTYYYQVIAVHEKSSANSAYSKVVSAVRDLAQPDVTVKLKSNGDPRVSWEKVSGAEKYIVYRATSKSGEYKKLKTTSKLAYADTSAKAGKTYYYKVKAVHKTSAANSAYSSVDSIKAK